MICTEGGPHDRLERVIDDDRGRKDQQTAHQGCPFFIIFLKPAIEVRICSALGWFGRQPEHLFPDMDGEGIVPELEAVDDAQVVAGVQMSRLVLQGLAVLGKRPVDHAQVPIGRAQIGMHIGIVGNRS